ncbi:hypothetical protein [Mesorhizobium sp. B2-8-3]|nr:hypothetical protein [Mesorhizobium sp. B2-8-3]
MANDRDDAGGHSRQNLRIDAGATVTKDSTAEMRRQAANGADLG